MRCNADAMDRFAPLLDESLPAIVPEWTYPSTGDESVADSPTGPDGVVDEGFIKLWAARQAAAADFGDQRLTDRFSKTLGCFLKNPTDHIPQACTDKHQAKAVYRFISNRRVTLPKLLRPIAAATANVCANRPYIYVVQDTSSLNYSSLHSTTGLGPLSGPGTCRGLQLHSTLALADDGTPLGLLDLHCWARQPKAKPKEKKGATKKPKKPPFEKRESFKWVHGQRAAREVIDETLPEAARPRLVHVFDREGDIHEVLQEISENGDDAIIRHDKDRNIEGPIGKSHAAVAAADLLGLYKVELPTTPKRAARTATLELRAARMTLKPDGTRKPDRRPCTFTLVEAREVGAPEGVEPIHWRLWTIREVATLAAACAVVFGYTLRWRVEDYHLTLKSGCGVERLQLETAERLTKAVLLYGPVAVQIVAMRDLGRRKPDAPCTELLTDAQWRVLWAYCTKKPADADQAPPTIRQAILWLGRLGGHMGRKGDGMPGVRTLWRGWRDLGLMMNGFEAAQIVARAGVHP